MQKKTDDFLRKHGMHFDTIDLHKETQAFRQQMQEGLQGNKSSLQMIPTFITVEKNLPVDREVIVIDAGGTNFRVACVRRGKDGKMTVSHFSKRPMPGTKERLDASAFYEQIADHLETVFSKTEADTVGFCFSFATEILPSKEGRICSFSKELKVDGAIGTLIGENLNRILKERGYKPYRFILLNDTVATMLGGIAAGAEKHYESYIGYILGTGTNTCYIEDCQNITKSPDAAALSGQMIINTENGSYGGFLQGTFDRELDAESKEPGTYRMEKMMSGAYQGSLIYKTVRGAVAEGLFSETFTEKFTKFDTFTMPQVDKFCADRNGDGDFAVLAFDPKDNEVLYEIIDVSFERAARLTAVVFAAILMQNGTGKDPQSPVCITAEGTSFSKAILYRPKLNRYMDEYLARKLGLFCDIISVEDATLTGAAVAALMD